MGSIYWFLGAGANTLYLFFSVGLLASVWGACGLRRSQYARFLCYVLLLSVRPFELFHNSPWNQLLIECLFFSSFLSDAMLTGLKECSIPMELAILLRWLLFRVMFGFAKFHF